MRHRKIFFVLAQIFLLPVYLIFSSQNILAASDDNFPNISGTALFESRSDRVLSTQKSDVSKNNSYINVEPHFSLNVNKNWSFKTDWRYSPFAQRDSAQPERFREILADNRGIMNEQGLYVEQLRAQFQNDDMRFYVGKFNPTFGAAWKRDKKIGVFTSEFTRDYELRGKVGVGGAALLEKSEINLSTFFNDVSGLSNTLGTQIGKEPTNDNVAGNTSTLSSYNLTIDGKDFLEVNNLTYNIGYSHLKTNSAPGRSDQEGYVAGFEYPIQTGMDTYIIPFIELAKINNMGGESSRNALYSTMALTGKYGGWSASVSRVGRNIRQKNQIGNMHDSQMQVTVGYRFRNGIGVDVSRMRLREDGYSASLVGLLVSYLYQF